MSVNPRPWSEVLSGVFAVLTAIATYLGTAPFNTLFAVLLGAAVTYSVQRRLQRDSEKRSKNVEYVEKYYGPLLVEIQKIQENVLDSISGYDYTRLEEFKTQPQFYSMGKQLKADFLGFADAIAKFSSKISYYKETTQRLICKFGNDYLSNPPGKRRRFASEQSYPPVYLKYHHKFEWFMTKLEDCILLGKDPVEMVKEKAVNFQEENIEVEFWLEVEDEAGVSHKSYEPTAFRERKEAVREIIAKVRAELDKDEGYRVFQSELCDLRQKALRLSARLCKYVEGYVSIVEI